MSDLAAKLNEIIRELNIHETRIDRIEAVLNELSNTKVPTLSVTDKQNHAKDRPKNV